MTFHQKIEIISEYIFHGQFLKSSKMVTELLVLFPTFLLYKYNVMDPKILLILLFTVYWLPKSIFIDLLANKFFPQIITRIDLKYRQIALTFDDLPYGYHQEIIGELDKYNQKATFFVISGQMDNQSRKVFIEAVKNGHQLGNHGKTNSMHALKSARNLIDEIDSCDRVIKQIYSEANVSLPTQMVYRPGCGMFTSSMLKIAKERNYRVVLGSVYPNDPFVPSSLINYFYLKCHIQIGDIVILHDRKWTAPCLKKLLPYLQDWGYKSVPLTENI